MTGRLRRPIALLALAGKNETMKQSLGILALGLMFALSACGGGAAEVAPTSEATVSSPEDVAYEQCIKDTAESVASLTQGDPADFEADKDVVAVCEGHQAFDEAMESLPAYTLAPAAEVDPECLRDWAESNMDMFEGLSVEEVMEDPMARFSCE